MGAAIPYTLPLVLVGMLLVPKLLKLLFLALFLVLCLALVSSVRTSVPDPPDCTARAATASAGLTATVAAYRTSHRVAKGRNIAATSSCIDGRFEILVGVSGQKSPAGSVPLPDDPVFDTYDPTGSGNTRSYDSERKLLEWINARTLPSSSGPVYLVSERPVCPSCSGVVTQFRAARPMIVLTVL